MKMWDLTDTIYDDDEDNDDDGGEKEMLQK